MVDIILIVILLAIIGLAAFYVCKAKMEEFERLLELKNAGKYPAPGAVLTPLAREILEQ